jgi:hypothetical protein
MFYLFGGRRYSKSVGFMTPNVADHDPQIGGGRESAALSFGIGPCAAITALSVAS